MYFRIRAEVKLDKFVWRLFKMASRGTPTFLRVSCILVLCLIVNYSNAEENTSSKDSGNELEEGAIRHWSKLKDLSAGGGSQNNESLVRKKRGRDEGTMTVHADRPSGVHWGGGGGNGNGGGQSNGGRPNSNSNRGIVNWQLAQAVLGETNSLCVLGDKLAPAKTPVPVFSVAGVGSLALEGAVGDSIVSGIGAAIGKLVGLGKNLASVTPMGVLIGSIGYVPSVGLDSDKVPGRTPENFISVSVPAKVMDLPDKETLRRAAKEAGVVNMPVRGELVTEKDVDIRVVRTPDVRPVKVVEAVRDEKTGLYNTGIPNTAVPGGKLVTTPPSVPTVSPGQRPLVNPIANPPVTVHTGNVGGLRSTLVRPFPGSEAHEDRDIVLVYPDNSGMDPVYVMFNKPRKGVAEADHGYIPAPRTEEITGFPGLIPQKRKTPRQGGGGLRERWKDPKGRTIYEWDSRHGDLEGYRASDGKHLGSFDHKTGAQRDGPKPERNLRKVRDLRQIKSLKLRLEWFDKSTDALVGGEYSRDLRDDGTVIEQLGLSIANNVNNGGYDVLPGWVGILQPYFKHRIDLNSHDYQVAFDYREWWEDMRVISFNLYETPGWRNENGRLIINLTPDVSGEIVRAVYHYHGLDFSRSMMRINLLGTSFDCDLGVFKDIEFNPTQKRLNAGQPFEVSHTERATRTNHDRLSFTKPIQIVLTFTVRVKV